MSDLSKEDKSRIKNCEYYLRTKKIMKNLEEYKKLEVGEVYYIKTKNRDGKEEYVSAGWNNEPAKYMVFHKDEDGFAFIKRILASGKMGKEVTCLTTSYDVEDYWLESDPDQVNSILLDNESGYDPMAASKEMTSKKNKARRRNKKLELDFDTHKAAHDYIKTLKVGDVIYDSVAAYGSGILSWKVTDVASRPVDNTDTRSTYQKQWGYPVGNTREDQWHNEHNLDTVVVVHVERLEKELPKHRRYVRQNRALTFLDFKNRWDKFYSKKPFTVDDV